MKLRTDLTITMTVDTDLGERFSAAIIKRNFPDEELVGVVVEMVMLAIQQGFESVNTSPSGEPPRNAVMYPIGTAMVQVLALERDPAEVGA